MAKEYRDYQVIDADGRVLMSRIDVLNDFAVEGANNGLGWSGGRGPFRIFARLTGGEGYGLIGEVPVGDDRWFTDTGLTPDLSIRP